MNKIERLHAYEASATPSTKMHTLRNSIDRLHVCGMYVDIELAFSLRVNMNMM